MPQNDYKNDSSSHAIMKREMGEKRIRTYRYSFVLFGASRTVLDGTARPKESWYGRVCLSNVPST